MLIEANIANFINIDGQGHCLIFIQGPFEWNFEISFNQNSTESKFYMEPK